MLHTSFTKRQNSNLNWLMNQTNWDSIIYIVKLSFQEKRLCIILKIQQKVVKI